MKKYFLFMGLSFFLVSFAFAESKTMYFGKDFEIEIQDDGTRIERIHVFAGDTKVATAETTRREREEPVTRMIYHHEDHLTGANADTDENGQVVQLSDYYPYGENRIDEHAEDYHNDYQFTGKERDEETGLSYYGARYYDSATGRFISRDPWEGDLRDPQSLNKYSYVLNNPLKYTDPTGEYNLWVQSGLEPDITFLSHFPKVEQYIRDNYLSRGVHSSIAIIPDDPSKFPELGNRKNIMIGGHEINGKLQVKINYPNDDNRKYIKSVTPIPLPDGLTSSDEHARKMLDIAKKVPSVDYDLFGRMFGGDNQGNCNNAATTIMQESGVSQQSFGNMRNTSESGVSRDDHESIRWGWGKSLFNGDQRNQTVKNDQNKKTSRTK